MTAVLLSKSFDVTFLDVLLQRVVRATMVTTSIVSVKFFTYLFMGSASMSDVPMYCLGIVSAYIGLNIGNALAQRLNQQVRSCLFPLEIPHPRTESTVGSVLSIQTAPRQPGPALQVGPAQFYAGQFYAGNL